MQVLAFTGHDPPTPVLVPLVPDDLPTDHLDRWAAGVLLRLETDCDVDLARPVYVVGGTLTVADAHGTIVPEWNRYAEALTQAKDALVARPATLS